MIIVPKKTNKKICLGLTWREYKCQCSYKECTSSMIDELFIDTWVNFRKKINIPLHITSGYRCPRHNHSKKVRGSKISSHKAGAAVDFAYTGKVAELPPEYITELALKVGFRKVYYYKIKKFFHLGV